MSASADIRWVVMKFGGTSVVAALLCSCGAPTAPLPPPGATIADGGRPADAGLDAASGAATHPPVEVFEGVVATATTSGGEPIVVEQRDGQRRLLVSGVVQGAAPLDQQGMLVAGDVVVEVIRTAHGRGGRVLVIGLGTGRTATELRAAGCEVDVVEREPAIIELARQHFGFSGDVTHAAGAAFLRQSREHYDVVLVDAFTGQDSPPSLREDATLRALRRRLAQGGLVVYRLLDIPSNPDVAALVERLGLRHSYALGDGHADERQTLYLVGSDAPFAATPVDEGGLHVITPGVAPAIDSAQGHSTTVVGYLTLVGGQPCIDLPHHHMGAVRYRLTGSEVASLRARLEAFAARHQRRERRERLEQEAAIERWKRAGQTGGRQVSPLTLNPVEEPAFPTAGDLGTDADTTRTLRLLLGGGGVKRSELRFSHLAVVVRGWAKVGEADGSLLPHGGALYELAVGEVLLVVDKKSWDWLRIHLHNELMGVEQCLRAGWFRQARAGIHRCLELMEQQLGPYGRSFLGYREVAALGRALDDELSGLGDQPSAFERAAACDRIATSLDRWSNPDAWKLDRAFGRCARSHYAQVARSPDHPQRRAAAGRLLHLLDRPGADWYFLPDSIPEVSLGTDAIRQRSIDQLHSRFTELEPRSEPPPPAASGTGSEG